MTFEEFKDEAKEMGKSILCGVAITVISALILSSIGGNDTDTPGGGASVDHV